MATNVSGSLPDSLLEEAGFEPSVPSRRDGLSCRADRERLSACVANCEKDDGTTSSNPLSSSGESGESETLCDLLSITAGFRGTRAAAR
jgi:hypothetical protein